MKISVIIPMYNEEKIVADTVKELDAALLRDFGEGEYEMLFVSDGSSDKCLEIANSLKDEYKALRPLGYEKNQGKGYAVRYGMLKTEGDFVLFTDCDLAYGVDVIKEFYDEWVNSGKDIVIGSRTIGKEGYAGYTLKRKIMSKMYIKYLNIVAGFKLSDSQCGIKGFSGASAHDIFAECGCSRWAFDLEAIMIAGRKEYTIGEKSVKIINHRESKMRPIHDAIEMTGEVRKIKKREKAKKKAAKNK